jgi:hypothetical protein
MSDGFEAVLVTLGQMNDEIPGPDATGGVGDPLPSLRPFGVTGPLANMFDTYMAAVGKADPSNCTCCGGATTGDPLALCPGCWTAIGKEDRLGHPHELSPAQRALVEESPRGGEFRVTIE